MRRACDFHIKISSNTIKEWTLPDVENGFLYTASKYFDSESLALRILEVFRIMQWVDHWKIRCQTTPTKESA